MTGGEKITKAAYTWLGTPHVNMAKVKGVGVDCGMLLIGTLEDAGLVTPGDIIIKPYSNEWHLHHSEEWFLSYVKQYCRKVKKPMLGDFLLYQFGRCISHAGIYVGEDRIIHAVVGQGVIMTGTNESMLFDNKGKSRLRAIYRFKGVK